MKNILKELLPDEMHLDCDIVMEPTLVGKTAELLARTGFKDTNLLLVCDKNTYAALGERVVKETNAKYLLLEGTPHPDNATINLIIAQNYDVLIAVGSGTISDLCKYASFMTQKDYAVFPTAPSMNGYFSMNASIIIEGHKQTLPAHLPKGVFCDLSVLANAPKRLILSGLGDSLCRPTAQADWLLSHLLFNTPYNPLPYTLLAPYEHELFSNSDKLTSGDIRVLELLMRTLIVSGMGMVIAGGSYPASQGEHLIAHTMEMKYGYALPYTYHGEQIGVTTLAMAEIQLALLGQRLHLQSHTDTEKKIAEYFGNELKKNIQNAYQSKFRLCEKYDAINERLNTEESAIRDAIKAITLPVDYLRAVLQKAGAPSTTYELGWQDRQLGLAITHAKFIRDRFTFLDLI